MGWVNVSSMDLNEHDIFAFVNIEEDTVLKGRLFTGSDGNKWISLMENNGSIYDCRILPSWTYSSTAEDVLSAVMKEFERLPGSDMQNRVFNTERRNFTAEQMHKLAIAACDAAIKNPTCVILMYVPDLSLTMNDMESFILTSELKKY